MNKKYVLTEEQIEYIKANWGIETIHTMKKKFGCSWYIIGTKATELGLVMPKKNEWSIEEVEELKRLSTKYHYEQIAVIMNKSVNAIYLKARRLKIELIQDRKAWTTEQMEYLAENWGTKTIETISKNMKRSIFSLKVKAIRMNLGSMISNNYNEILLTDLREIFGVSYDRISNTWVRAGLKIKNVRITKN